MLRIRSSLGSVAQLLPRAAVFGALSLSIFLPSAIMAKVTIGGPFMLSAPDGKTVTDQTFRGRWLLVYFGYTSCPSSCPTALVQIGKSLGALGPDADKVGALFITLDPGHDTRDVMADYMRSFDPRILGLTGTPEQIASVVGAYGVYVQQRDGESSGSIPLIDHSTYIYLMSPAGTFVRAFDHDASADRIAAALRADIKRAAETSARQTSAAGP